ncbi:hypothetical protein HNY73_009594 [Argiope bruennichi]|uniref:Mos1 transposase HTH domain-containing protein n=1 Tax=Argiope bruennichi TaxID=94029 RepID=A0A8T0FCT0_ARGBR|nr:hypothetical protein HNY73_009594 [Argiope bruennichi]
MCAAKENPAKCEVRLGVIMFFTAKGTCAAIHRELCAVYGPKVMSEGVVREWVRVFKKVWDKRVLDLKHEKDFHNSQELSNLWTSATAHRAIKRCLFFHKNIETKILKWHRLRVLEFMDEMQIDYTAESIAHLLLRKQLPFTFTSVKDDFT